MVGVATNDIDINISSYEKDKNYGWYYYFYDGYLFSGPPHNYQHKPTNLKSQINEIKIIMNMKNRILKFILDNEDKGYSYTDIPLNKSISPSIILCDANDSVEIICN